MNRYAGHFTLKRLVKWPKLEIKKCIKLLYLFQSGKKQLLSQEHLVASYISGVVAWWLEILIGQFAANQNV